jgi:hypothetical protein
MKVTPLKATLMLCQTQNCGAAEMSRSLPLTGGGDGESGRPEGDPGPDNVAYGFVFLSRALIICPLYKSTISDQGQAILLLSASLSDVV